MLTLGREIYNNVEYAWTTIPTYPCGQIGFFLGSLGESCKIAKRKPTSDMELNYYTNEIHSASFVLPQFAKKALNL